MFRTRTKTGKYEMQCSLASLRCFVCGYSKFYKEWRFFVNSPKTLNSTYKPERCNACRVRKDTQCWRRCIVVQNLNIIRKLVMNYLKGIELPISTKKKNWQSATGGHFAHKTENACGMLALQRLQCVCPVCQHLRTALVLEKSAPKLPPCKNTLWLFGELSGQLDGREKNMKK